MNAPYLKSVAFAVALLFLSGCAVWVRDNGKYHRHYDDRYRYYHRHHDDRYRYYDRGHRDRDSFLHQSNPSRVQMAAYGENPDFTVRWSD